MKLALLIAIAGCVTATTGAAQTAGSPGAAKPDKKVCRSSTPTGSIMPGKRVCRTAQEWAAMDADEAAANANFRERATNNAIPR